MIYQCVSNKTWERYNDMYIYLLDINKEMTNAWHKYFGNINNVEIINDDFAHFMNTHPNIEAVVSPANAYGLMDGGYDGAITRYFGEDLQHKVQNIIVKEWYGEQPVGTSLTVLTDKAVANSHKLIRLIHTPTMRSPEAIIDPRIVYQCMRTTLIEAEKQDVHSIVIPAFGGLCGKVPCKQLAEYMYLAYEQFVTFAPHNITWQDAMDTQKKLQWVMTSQKV